MTANPGAETAVTFPSSADTGGTAKSKPRIPAGVVRILKFLIALLDILF